MGIKTFTLRLNDEQLQYIEKRAKEKGVSKNEYIRSLIDGEIREDKQDLILTELLEIKRILESRKE